MQFLPRESIVHEMINSLQTISEKYDVDDIGVFEEEGEGNQYFLGYTIRKNGEVFMIHQPYSKNEEGELAPVNREWVIEEEEKDTRGYETLDDVFQYISNQYH